MNEEKNEEEIIPQEKKVEPIKEKLTPAFDNLESSIKTWWATLKQVINIYLVALLYSLIPLGLIILLVFLSSMAWFPEIIGMIISVLAVLVIIYFIIKAYVTIVLLLKSDFTAEPKTLFKEADKYVVDYIGLAILTSILILLWALLLIIPAIIFSVFYSLVYMVFFFEDKKGMKAIRRSKELVKGYFWPVFGRMLLIGIAMSLVFVIISIPNVYFPEESLAYGLWNLLIQIISFLIAPISLFFTYNIYKDLKKIKA
ncbi:hypothetical protein JXK06_02255 [Patescibacteria group bacterium]|nr:hypothetical protein [Patescibacteria group bacterium]